jgi:hypothetical protein
MFSDINYPKMAVADVVAVITDGPRLVIPRDEMLSATE